MSPSSTINGTLGTSSYGLSRCWACRAYHDRTEDDVKVVLAASHCIHETRTVFTAVPDIHVALSRKRGEDCYLPYYLIDIRTASGTQKRVAVLSYRQAARLLFRYQTRDVCVTDVSNITEACSSGTPCYFNICEHSAKQHCLESMMTWLSVPRMPGQENASFLRALHLNIQEKYFRDIRYSWTVSPDLYSLWACTSGVTVELFADCINESGVLSRYCRADKEDVIFGSSGTWQQMECVTEGAAANPPYETSLVKELLACFERGVRKERPYCRCVLFPLAKKYGVLGHLKRLSTEGLLLVTIPGGVLPFRSQADLLSYDYKKPKAYGYQQLGLFIWSNREYLLKYPPPMDIESAYMRWAGRALTHPASATIHLEAFKKAFPMELRSSNLVSGDFELR